MKANLILILVILLSGIAISQSQEIINQFLFRSNLQLNLGDNETTLMPKQEREKSL